MNKNPKFQHLEVFKWKKGESGNIAGRPKSAITVLKELGYTKPVIATFTAEIAFMEMKELQNIRRRNDDEPAIRAVIAEAFGRAAYYGEYKYIEPFMKLLIGNPVPVLKWPEITDNNTENEP